jgi:hypothetical protein
MKRLWLGVLAVGVMAGFLAVQAYEPPEIIGKLRGEPPDSQNFGLQFCWVGDQNGDGYDDLLVSHDYSSNPDHVNAVKLYFGGEEVDNDPDMVFGPTDQDTFSEAYGEKIGYLGRLSGDNSNWFVIHSYRRWRENDRSWGMRLNLYRGGEDLDDQADIVMSLPKDAGYYDVGDGINKRPADFNSDGYDDLLVGWRITEEAPGRLAIFYGGEEFDTIPDWTAPIKTDGFHVNGSHYATGGDVNGDGFDDFGVAYLSERADYDSLSHVWFALYLGGDPMDTTAYLELPDDAFAGNDRKLDPWTTVILPDVNDDGYDDWGIYWSQSFAGWEIDGYYVYFGSEEPDTIPDLDLEGNHNIFGTDGKISGGDFNGDGVGDILAINPDGYMGESEMHLYFGSQWVAEDAAIIVNIYEHYGTPSGANPGAIGDYNGDGNMDFVSAAYPAWGDWVLGNLTVFSGSRDWRVSVPESYVSIPIQNWDFTVSPNPFNDSIKLIFTGAALFHSQIELLDIRGNVVWDKTIPEPLQEFTLSSLALPTGVYILRVQDSGGGLTPKVIYRKAVLIR